MHEDPRDRLTRGEIRKDALQDTVEATATAVGTVTTIVTTAFGSIDRAVEAMRQGAYDFLTKPIDPTQLKIVMDRALTKRALQDEQVLRCFPVFRIENGRSSTQRNAMNN